MGRVYARTLLTFPLPLAYSLLPSQDDSVAVIQQWMHRFSTLGIAVVFTQRAESAVTCVRPSCALKPKSIVFIAVGWLELFRFPFFITDEVPHTLAIGRLNRRPVPTCACWMRTTSCFRAALSSRFECFAIDRSISACPKVSELHPYCGRRCDFCLISLKRPSCVQTR